MIAESLRPGRPPTVFAIIFRPLQPCSAILYQSTPIEQTDIAIVVKVEWEPIFFFITKNWSDTNLQCRLTSRMVYGGPFDLNCELPWHRLHEKVDLRYSGSEVDREISGSTILSFWGFVRWIGTFFAWLFLRLVINQFRIGYIPKRSPQRWCITKPVANNHYRFLVTKCPRRYASNKIQAKDLAENGSGSRWWYQNVEKWSSVSDKMICSDLNTRSPLKHNMFERAFFLYSAQVSMCPANFCISSQNILHYSTARNESRQRLLY